MSTARSALSVILPHENSRPIGKPHLVCLAVKGVFDSHPPRPMHSVFWDVNKVFALFNSWEATPHLYCEKLSLKLISYFVGQCSERTNNT